MIGRLILREVRRGFSGPAWLPAAFFLLVATLVPFAVGPDARLLARIGAGAISTHELEMIRRAWRQTAD